MHYNLNVCLALSVSIEVSIDLCLTRCLKDIQISKELVYFAITKCKCGNLGFFPKRMTDVSKFPAFIQ
jgi:hypothetical protein